VIAKMTERKSKRECNNKNDQERETEKKRRIPGSWRSCRH